ncbi:MAG: hypothetical protein H7249_05085 [Chitinophagaceae bacterium]|nr:hypothetical protein [Oligoflexus sp.]
MTTGSVAYYPGFIGIINGVNLTTVRIAGETVKLYHAATLPANTKQVYPCNAGLRALGL